MPNVKCKSFINPKLFVKFPPQKSLLFLQDTKTVKAYIEKHGTSFDFFNDDFYNTKGKKAPIKRAPNVENVYQVPLCTF